MKKLFPVVCLLLILLTGCSSIIDHRIESHTWRMTTVQSVNAEGQIIAHAPGQVGSPETSEEITLTCTAKDGVLTLNDESSNQTYTGSYKLSDSVPESSNYEVVIGETDGMAVVSVTTYLDDSSVPTLIIRIGDYALNFAPDTI